MEMFSCVLIVFATLLFVGFLWRGGTIIEMECDISIAEDNIVLLKDKLAAAIKERDKYKKSADDIGAINDRCFNGWAKTCDKFARSEDLIEGIEELLKDYHAETCGEGEVE